MANFSEDTARNLVDFLCPECSSKDLKVGWLRMEFRFRPGLSIQDVVAQATAANRAHVVCASLLCETCECTISYDEFGEYQTRKGNDHKTYKRKRGEGLVLTHHEIITDSTPIPVFET